MPAIPYWAYIFTVQSLYWSRSGYYKRLNRFIIKRLEKNRRDDPMLDKEPNMTDSFKESSLRYHTHPIPGKLEIRPTKPLANKRDLSLAYSPGVAYACELIQEDPTAAASVTSRGNLVAVISNGTAVLGLGDIGPLASKPVMEDTTVLF